MNKLKDLFYNLNDVIVALLIIALAGAVILWRVDSIMAYPQYLASRENQGEEPDIDMEGIDLNKQEVQNFNQNPEDFDAEPTDENLNPGVDTPIEGDDPVIGEEPPKSEEPIPQTPKDVEFVIPEGAYGSTVGDLLQQQGLISSSKEFVNSIMSKKLDTKLMPGKYTIPANASLDEIINILTKH